MNRLAEDQFPQSSTKENFICFKCVTVKMAIAKFLLPKRFFELVHKKWYISFTNYSRNKSNLVVSLSSSFEYAQLKS